MDCQGHRGNLLRVMENFYNIIILYTFVKIHQIIPIKLVHYVLKKEKKNCTFLTIPLEYGECIVHQAFRQYFSLKKNLHDWGYQGSAAKGVMRNHTAKKWQSWQPNPDFHFQLQVRKWRADIRRDRRTSSSCCLGPGLFSSYGCEPHVGQEINVVDSIHTRNFFFFKWRGKE